MFRRTMSVLDGAKLSLLAEIFAVCFSLLFSSTSCGALREIKLTAEFFPDEKLRSVIAAQADTNNDNILSNEEILAVKSISAPNMGIKVVTGIGYFTELERLDLSGNDFNDSTVTTKNPKLKVINFKDNPNLNSVNVYSNPLLEDLDVSGTTKLGSLSLSNNKVLRRLVVNCNGWWNLDLTNNKELENLSMTNFQGSSLNLSVNTKLQRLKVNHTSIKSIDISHNKDLVALDLADNMLTTMNIPVDTKIDELNLSRNQLTSFDTHGKKFSTLEINDNRYLVNSNSVALNSLPGRPAANRILSVKNGTLANGKLSATTKEYSIRYKYNIGGEGSQDTAIFTIDFPGSIIQPEPDPEPIVPTGVEVPLRGYLSMVGLSIVGMFIATRRAAV